MLRSSKNAKSEKFRALISIQQAQIRHNLALVEEMKGHG